MKKIIALLLVLVMVLGMVACNGESKKDDPKVTAGDTKPEDTKGDTRPDDTKPQAGTSELAGTYDIVMWVSEKEGVADQFKAQIDAFEAANPGIIINAQIEGVTEADAGSKVTADVASAPDIYCFAQDQLARLVQADALAAPGKKAAENVVAANDAGSVAAASVAGTLYAYPMTSDNGYFMYYDKSIISEEDAEDLAKIVAACEKNDKKFRYALENAWYTAGFFFATGCHSNWTVDADGKTFNAVDDNFNSAEGMAAMKGMQILAKSPIYDSNADVFTDAGVVITGIWAAADAKAHFGDNMGVTDLPSFTVDGKSYHLGSYTGNKLMGVKPQSDAKRGAVLSQLAQYLTGEECQLARFKSFEWGPSNKAAQASPEVMANPSLAALAKQNEYGIPQGQIHGSWWDTAKVLGAEAKAATSDADLQKALDNYTTAINGVFQMSDDQKNAFTIIGAVKGTMWDTDFAMKQDPAGTWTSEEAFELAAGTEFKVRQGLAWDVAYGDNTANADTSVPLSNKPNYVVETAGTYYIQLVVNADGTGVINLVPAK